MRSFIRLENGVTYYKETPFNYCICVVGVLRVVVKKKKRKITDWKKHNSYPGSDSYRAFVLWPKMDLLRRRGAEPTT